MRLNATFNALRSYLPGMNRRRLIAFACFSLAATAAQADLFYTLKPDPASTSLKVTLKVEKGAEVEKFRIPAWCPGFYFLLDYDKKITDVKAIGGDGQPLEITSPERREWDVKNPSGGSVTLSYSVTGDDGGLGFFSDNVKSDKAFSNGAATFMYPVTRTLEKDHLKVVLPDKWDIATTLDQEEGGYVAGGYDELIDYPIQMGAFQRRKFMVEGIPFEAIFVSPDNTFAPNIDRETEVLRAVSKPPIVLFGKAGFKRYMYLFHLAVGNFAGGLEHRASTCIAIPNSTDLNLADLAAHEYFHSWNVKQIRPVVLGPFDYTQKVRTANLWFAEGVTDYYAKIVTYRSGAQPQSWLISSLNGQIRGLQNGKTRFSLTLADCSRQAWENGGFGVGDLSYYTKGLVAGLIFDAAIRAKTDGKKSLDDVMRLLFDRYRLPNAGYPEDGILKAINEVAGTDLSNLYQQIVYSTREMPYELLGYIGMELDPQGNLRLKPDADAAALKLREGWLRIP